MWLNLFCLLFILGCTSVSEERLDSSVHQLRQNALAKIDVIACVNRGGVVKSVCMFGMPTCVQVYTDAGKHCSDSSECLGECRKETNFVESGTQAQGICSADADPCGCSQTIINGIAQAPLCVD